MSLGRQLIKKTEVGGNKAGMKSMKQGDDCRNGKDTAEEGGKKGSEENAAMTGIQSPCLCRVVPQDVDLQTSDVLGRNEIDGQLVVGAQV